MFWGKGDSGKLDEKSKATLEDLRRLEESGHIVTLDASRAMVAIQAIEFYDDWKGFLGLAERFRNIAILIGFLLTAYWATEGWIVEKLVELIGGKG